MSAERDVDRIVRSWLRIDEHESADPILGIVLSRLDTTPQRRPWAAWRTPMHAPIKLIATAAAVLVVAVAGYQFLPAMLGPGGPSTGPSTAPIGTPATTAAPTATPVATVIPRLPDVDPVPAGTYRIDTVPALILTLPSGWINYGTGVRKNVDNPNEMSIDIYGPDIRVFADACRSSGTEALVGPTAADLVAALRDQASSDLGDPIDTVVAGLPGQRLDIAAPADLDVGKCPFGSLQVWVDSNDSYLAGQVAGDVATAFVVDTPSGRLVFTRSYGKASPTEKAELDAIIASLRIAD